MVDMFPGYGSVFTNNILCAIHLLASPACRANGGDEPYGGGANGVEGRDIVRVFDGESAEGCGRDGARPSLWCVAIRADAESGGDGGTDRENGERDV